MTTPQRNLAASFLIRLVLTLLLLAWAVQPFTSGSSQGNILEDVSGIGIPGTMLIVGLFFGMVAFYCRTLQKCLALIKPENRKAKPHSVWYMFAIPFNFVEDFFIVIDLANSLEEEKKTNVGLRDITDYGMVSGIGWCIAQLLSFVPGLVGQLAGAVGMLLVFHHWIHISRINRLLLQNQGLNRSQLTPMS
ncbi:hypothetical protein GCM10023185_36350 [Hymenobacter saemangeumensis]|uniref:Uncharacterized protein n=1 Tax=Hymenobacter saemangeumensis TaxID=1084522 RepID=A0ABP8IQX3_9BACT